MSKYKPTTEEDFILRASGQVRAEQRDVVRKATQENILKLIRQGDRVVDVLKSLQVNKSTLRQWQEIYPEFGAAYRRARAEGKAMLEGRMEDIVPLAMDVLEETLEGQNEDKGKAWDAAKATLQGRGYLTQRQEIKAEITAKPSVFDEMTVEALEEFLDALEERKRLREAQIVEGTATEI